MTTSSRTGTATYDKEALLQEFRRATGATLASKTQLHIEAAESVSFEWSERIWSWLSRPNHDDAVAPCLAAEVVDLDEVIPKNKSATYYRLGRVPCMHVSLVGMLVGLTRYEKRDVYYVDDGTAVIDCVVRHDGVSGYDLVLPPPHAREGDYVRVMGKVVSQRDGRGLGNAIIKRCRSEAEVLRHRRLVQGLYKERYEDTDPFEILIPVRAPTPPAPVRKEEDSTGPPREQSPACPHSPSPSPQPRQFAVLPRTPVKTRARVAPASPALSEASAYTASAAGSPTKTPRRAPYHKLRHPTRIRRQDTTSVLFRTYLMHYITHGPSRPEFQDESDDESGLPEIIKTPTKRRPLTDLTPRPNKRLHRSPSPTTPRATALPTSLSLAKEPETIQRGFTMSHLRRVPELALLANKLHRHISQEHASQSRRHNEPAKVKIKRLFTKTLIDLHNRGSIVIVGREESVHPLPERGRGWDLDGSRLWKAGSSSSQTQGGDVSRASTRSGRSRTQEPDLDDLSEPEDEEEAYVACSARLLAAPVLSVLLSLSAEGTRKAHSRRGPTTARVTEALRKKDGMWDHIGDLQVEEALQLLQSEWRARKDGPGTWSVLKPNAVWTTSASSDFSDTS